MGGRVQGQYITEGKIMRSWSYVVVIAAVTGCSAKTIDAGTNATGAGKSSASPVSEPTTVASLIQRPPTRMASDGTTLFWSDGSNVSSMPVGGGTIHTLMAGYLLSVDDLGIYVYETDAIYRVPKDGGARVLISDASSGSMLFFPTTTTSGTNAYWAEGQTNQTNQGLGVPMQLVVIKTAPLHGGPITTIAQFESEDANGLGPMAVTANTVFIFMIGPSRGLASFSTSAGVPDGGLLQPLPGTAASFCSYFISDDDAVYCDRGAGSITRIANDGTVTTLGTVISTLGFNATGITLDDANVYWLDQTTVGTVMKVSKRGGTVTTLARDTTPIAIAVDATSVYWSDVGGNIKRIPK
jgi:hypothetical protein